MMRRLVISLIGLLALAAPAWASTIPYSATVPASHGSGTTATCTVPSNSLNDGIIFEVTQTNSNAQTGPALPASGWTSTCFGGTYKTCLYTRNSNGSEPATYSATWTGSVTWSCAIYVTHNTDGTAATLDGTPQTATSNSTGSLAAAAITTTQANDLIYFIEVTGATPNALPVPVASVQLASGTPLQSMGYIGQTAAGASLAPTFTMSSGVANIATVAYKQNSTKAAYVVGVGADSFNGGSFGSVSPTVATNASSTDTNLAFVIENTNTGIAITPPSTPDIAVVASLSSFQNCSGCQTFTIPAAVQTGDLMAMWMVNPNTMTAPAGCSGSWTLQCSNSTFNFNGVWTKVAAACDAGHSYSWTGQTGNVNRGFSVYRSGSGATLALDVAACGSATSTATPAPPNVTTTVANDSVQTMIIAMNSSNTPTVPAGETQIWNNNAAGTAAGYYVKSTAGTTATQSYTTNSQNWETAQFAVKGSGAAPIAWTRYGSAIVNPGASVELDTFTTRGLPAGVTEQFVFASNPGKSDGFIVDIGNLNAVTPIDVQATTSANSSASGPIWPTIIPRNDEILLRAGSLATAENGPIINLIQGALGNAGIGPASNAGQFTSTSGNLGAYATETLGLDSATTVSGGWFAP